jgi:hypothetical protein
MDNVAEFAIKTFVKTKVLEGLLKGDKKIWPKMEEDFSRLCNEAIEELRAEIGA